MTTIEIERETFIARRSETCRMLAGKLSPADIAYVAACDPAQLDAIEDTLQRYLVPAVCI